MKKLLVILFISIFSTSFANEGMWLPQLLERLNEKEMKRMGMKISARDIYNINNGSLKDAIVSFGGFCTGEVISSQGLVLTNHHCGFDAIQNHSTLDHNYIQDGFWAKNKGEEIPNAGLFVTFIIKIEDVSREILNGVKKTMSESERQSIIDKNIADCKKKYKLADQEDLLIRSFFDGNQYFLFVTETYRDIRLVGAPPSSIGNFGKDTDNWMWPRHTADFSVFRIYAGKDNKPAAYSKDNVPYKPKKSLSISLDGVAQGDFTMVFGFPGRTNEYLHSSAVDQIMKVSDPAKINIRAKALNVIDGFMRKDEQIKIQYAAKYASISNAWKKWQGEILGLTKTDGVGKKVAYENEFQKRVFTNALWKEEYGTLLNDLSTAYKENEPYALARDYYTEIASKIELFAFAGQINILINTYEKDGEKGYNQKIEQVKEKMKDLYGEYNAVVDQKLFESLMEMYVDENNHKYSSAEFNNWLKKQDGSFSKLAKHVFDGTKLDNGEVTIKNLSLPASELVALYKNHPFILLYNDIVKTYSASVTIKLNEVQNRINKLQRTYMQAQMDVMKEKAFYPDANSTLRVTYGNVKGYEPRDGVKYDIHTYLDGVMEKYVPDDYEFDVPQKLRDLYANKDFGKYGSKGKMPVCFIAANHTTGGNSGSPALDAYGNLVGLNFDRVWEGTMSDINYDPSICRNIMVDIRYVLFIIDKFAGAGHLVDEMKLVHPKALKK